MCVFYVYTVSPKRYNDADNSLRALAAFWLAEVLSSSSRKTESEFETDRNMWPKRCQSNGFSSSTGGQPSN